MLQAAVPVVVPILAILLMFVVGMELTVEDFRRAGRQWRLVGLALLLQLAVTPLIALGLIEGLQPKAYVAAGILLVAVCPSGGLANFYTYLGRAHLALSVTVTAVSCVAAAAAMPFLLALFRTRLPEPAALDLPIPLMMGQLLALLVFPVLLGMGARRRWPALTARHGKKLLGLGLVALGALLAVVFAQEKEKISGDFMETWVVVTLLTLAMMAVGLAAGRLGGWPAKDGFALAMVLSVRNVSVAVAVAVSVLNRLEFAVFGMAYFIHQTPLLLGAALLARRPQPHAQASAPLSKLAA